jgi:hypothetical protein
VTGWKIAFLVVGAVVPLVVAALTIYFGLPRTRGKGTGSILVGTGLGLLLGAIGGLIVCALVIGLVLALRAAVR